MKTPFFRVVPAFALISFLLATLPVAAQTAPPPDLDAWVARAMKEFEVPAIALAIVKDGSVVLTNQEEGRAFSSIVYHIWDGARTAEEIASGGRSKGADIGVSVSGCIPRLDFPRQ